MYACKCFCCMSFFLEVLLHIYINFISVFHFILFAFRFFTLNIFFIFFFFVFATLRLVADILKAVVILYFFLSYYLQHFFISSLLFNALQLLPLPKDMKQANTRTFVYLQLVCYANHLLCWQVNARRKATSAALAKTLLTTHKKSCRKKLLKKQQIEKNGNNNNKIKNNAAKKTSQLHVRSINLLWHCIWNTTPKNQQQQHQLQLTEEDEILFSKKDSKAFAISVGCFCYICCCYISYYNLLLALL